MQVGDERRSARRHGEHSVLDVRNRKLSRSRARQREPKRTSERQPPHRLEPSQRGEGPYGAFF